MIKRYRYGQPIPTDTIVKEIPICNESIAFFQLENKKKRLLLIRWMIMILSMD